MAASTPRKVAIVGHSFITRLDDYMNDNPDCYNLRLEKENFDVKTRGIEGLRVQQLAASRDLIKFDGEQDICFLQIGSNDLTDACTPVQLIVELILTLAKFLIKGKDYKAVIIGQLLRRQPCVAGESYNERVIHANNLLHIACAQTEENIVFWHHRGFWNPQMSFLAEDGINIRYSIEDPSQMRKYMHSIRCSLLYVSNRLTLVNGKIKLDKCQKKQKRKATSQVEDQTQTTGPPKRQTTGPPKRINQGPWQIVTHQIQTTGPPKRINQGPWQTVTHQIQTTGPPKRQTTGPPKRINQGPWQTVTHQIQTTGPPKRQTTGPPKRINQGLGQIVTHQIQTTGPPKRKNLGPGQIVTHQPLQSFYSRPQTNRY